MICLSTLVCSLCVTVCSRCVCVCLYVFISMSFIFDYFIYRYHESLRLKNLVSLKQCMTSDFSLQYINHCNSDMFECHRLSISNSSLCFDYSHHSQSTSLIIDEIFVK